METFLSDDTPVRMDSRVPPGPGSHPALLLIHGAGGAAPFWMDRIAPVMARLGVAAYAVHYFDKTQTAYADTRTILDGVHFPLWLSAIRDGHQYLASQHQIDSQRIAVLGVSLGSFLACALSAQSRGIAALISISGGVPPELKHRVPPHFPPTLILHGEADTVVPVTHARMLSQLLAEQKIAHHLRTFPGEGHFFSAAAQFAIAIEISQCLQHYFAR